MGDLLTRLACGARSANLPLFKGGSIRRERSPPKAFADVSSELANIILNDFARRLDNGQRHSNAAAADDDK